jgi:hypothetical protein
VLVGEVPLQFGTVTFQPDATKGNSSHHQPTAGITPQGTYELFTVGKVAAPLGWYKVMVSAHELEGDPENKAGGRRFRNRINSKYEDLKTTPLSIEVVEHPAPGAYDLKVTK